MSSSTFTLEIKFELVDGRYLSFEAQGGTPETGRIDYFDYDALVTVSPKELATASTVEEMIQLLIGGVLDYEIDKKPVFVKSNFKKGSGSNRVSAYDFIEEIRSKVASMDDIDSVTITGNEDNYVSYKRTYTYERTTDTYYGEEHGCEFDKNGSSGGYLQFDLTGCRIVTDLDRLGDYYPTSIAAEHIIPQGTARIANSAFEKCCDLRSVVIPEGVTAIGKNAFAYCENLETITLPDSLERIDSNAFFGCSKLESITIPGSLKKWGLYTFDDCTNLKRVTINDGVKKVGYSAFADCKSLEDISLPNSVRRIEQCAFDGCESLKEISLPRNLNVIDYGAFSFTGLTNIDIPEDLTIIEGHAFECSRLESVVIPKGVRIINESTFDGCESITSVTIPDGVTRIDADAFRGCCSLTSITIPDSVEIIGNGAFTNCNSLSHVVLGRGLKKIEKEAFFYCKELNNFIIPDSVTEIGPSAFKGCNGLTNITLPSNLKELGKCVFQSCKKLTEVVLCDGITSIPEQAFMGCTALKSISIPNSVKKIEKNAFKTSKKLGNLLLPAGIMLGENAFHDTLVEQTRGKRNDDDGKLDLTIDAVPTVSDWRKLFRFKYTDGFVEIIGCNIQDDIIEVPSMIGKKTVKTIGHRAFDGRKLPDRDSFEVILPTQRKIVIPDGVDEISRGAFYCINNREIVLPDTVTELPSGMLIAVHNVTLHLSANVKAISDDLVWDSPDDCIRIIAPAGSFAEQYAIERGLLVV